MDINEMETAVSAYWLKFYTDRYCTLCGNTGIIDTRHARTSSGLKVGGLNYCICPNGQAMRRSKGNVVF